MRTIIGLLDTDVQKCDDLGNAQLLFFKKVGGHWQIINLSAQCIKSIKAREVVDSAGRPILEVTVETEGCIKATEASPTGTTVGAHEPFVLEDGGERYNGLGVLNAVEKVHKRLAPALMGLNVFKQQTIDKKMRGLDTAKDMKNIGGNSIGSISATVLRVAAACMGMQLCEFIAGGAPTSLPLPIFNIVNGVRSEYLQSPVVPGASGGYAAPSEDPVVTIGLMATAVEECGYNCKVGFAIDSAACDVYNKEDKTYPFMGKRVTAEELIPHLKTLASKFPMVFMEDVFDEDAFEEFAEVRDAIPETVIVGDDLTVTNPNRMRKAHKLGAIDGFVFKPNQAGTVTRAIEALNYAKKTGWLIVPSARGGGPITDIVRDFSLGAGGIHFYKAGAPVAGHRTPTLSEAMRVEDEYGATLCTTVLADCCALPNTQKGSLREAVNQMI